MIRIAIVEDEKDQSRLLNNLILQWACENILDVQIISYDDGSDLVDEYSGQFDLLFLDIKMNKLDGINTAKMIRQRDQRVLIVFVTNMMQYAIDGYEVDAVDFIVKPLNYLSFSKRMERVKNKLSINNGTIVSFKMRKETLYLNATEILYVETENKKTLIHTKDSSYLCTETMYEVEQKLMNYHFYRIHNAYLVHLSAIECIDCSDVLIYGKRLPISKYRKKDFLHAFAKFEGFNS